MKSLFLLSLLSLSFLLTSCGSDNNGGNSSNRPAATVQPNGGGAGNGGGGNELTTPEDNRAEVTSSEATPVSGNTEASTLLDFYSVEVKKDQDKIVQSVKIIEIQKMWDEASDLTPDTLDPEKEYLLFTQKHTLEPDVFIYLYLSKEIQLGIREASITSLKKQPRQLSVIDIENMKNKQARLVTDTKDAEIGADAFFFDFDETIYSGYNLSQLTTASTSTKISMKNGLRIIPGDGVVLMRTYSNISENLQDTGKNDIQYLAFFSFFNAVEFNVSE